MIIALTVLCLFGCTTDDVDNNDKNSNTITAMYEFDGCKMNGSLTSGKSAVFIGNVYQMTNELKLIIKNFTFGENAKVNWTYTEDNLKFDGLFGTKSSNYQYNVEKDDVSIATLEDSKFFGKGENSINLSVNKTNENKLRISNDDTVKKYTVVEYLYANYTESKTKLTSRPSNKNGTQVWGISATFDNKKDAEDFVICDFVDYYDLTDDEKDNITKNDTITYCGILGSIVRDEISYYVVQQNDGQYYYWLGQGSKKAKINVCAFTEDNSFGSFTIDAE